MREERKPIFKVNRHMHPEFWGVSDEEALRQMAEFSAKLDAERYKAEAWDKLKDSLKDMVTALARQSRANHSRIATVKSMLGLMDVIYKEIEEDDQWG
ncbi:hypothetical protein [Lacicoccus qingdaonensis]|uniref:Uncharacterized protein n=1 Tax=Lacicoccus qingdaonensis TaxID=576118 RepID=A0A1G9F0J6_9BACL|nr:hypothetical protein [Salinicoccus qingdaonensis]SDK81986.1 hypothetical protein SAMN05216216_11075 [Salinicoccus qingdaonensis]